MSAPKTYSDYSRRAVERGEIPLSRDDWKKRRTLRRAAMEKRDMEEISGLEELAADGDSCAMAELESLEE